MVSLGKDHRVNREEGQPLACPCKSPEHARFDYLRLYQLCQLDPHPGPTESPFPDPETSHVTPPGSPMHDEDMQDGNVDSQFSVDPAEDHHTEQNELEFLSDAQAPIEENQSPRLRESGSLEPDSSLQMGFIPSQRSLQATSSGHEPSLQAGLDVDDVTGVVDEPMAYSPPASPRIGVYPHRDNDQPDSDVLAGRFEALDMEDEEDGESSSVEGDEMGSEMVVDELEYPKEVKEASRDFLRQFNIIVESVFRLTICTACKRPVSYLFMRGHQKSEHFNSRNIPAHLQIPAFDLLLPHFRILGAINPLDVPVGPIAPISGVKTVKGFRCETGSCMAKPTVKKGRSTLNDHFTSVHHDVPVGERVFTPGVDCQSLGGFYNKLRYVEVLPALPSDVAALQALDQLALDCSLFQIAEVFTYTDNARDKNAVFAQTRWDEVLNGVNMRELRNSALPASKEKEPELERLRLLLREYYEEILLIIPMISVLTRRYIVSPNPDNALKDQPFRRPQERGTVMVDSDCIAQFLSFLIRTLRTPVLNFEVVLHSDTLLLIRGLVTLLEDRNSHSEIIKIRIHSVVWSLLSQPSPEFIRNELKCPFTRFLIAVHIRDNSGNFQTAKQITPTIAKAQWCFRASGSQELVNVRDEFDGDTQRAYEEHIQTFLVDKHQVLFTTMRQHMKYFSALAYAQKGIGRLMFNIDKSVISFDGYPIRVLDLGDGVKASIRSLWDTMKLVFRGCRFDDTMALIDEAMNPDPSARKKWWRDVLQNTDVSYGLVTDPDNGLLALRPRLKNHLAQDEKLFSVVDGKLVANRAECFEWLALVNDVTRELFALVMATVGGGARGTEFEKLLYANHPRHTRNLFFVNGFLTFITEYLKTQHMTGAGKTIARIAAFAVNRILILHLSQVYYAASHVCLAVGMPKEDCERYLYEVFVINGKSMTSEKYSASLGTWTSTHLGIELKLRDFRQLMSCLLITFTGCSFFDRDDEDVVSAHESFGHSVEVGQQHYGLLVCNGGTSMATDTMAKMQRVSLRWHGQVGVLPPTFQKTIKTDANGLPTAASSKELDVLLKGTLDKYREYMDQKWLDWKQETRVFLQTQPPYH
ncbi:hypothetical protein V5O48_018605 [Marasmius crinis-equi]|uniref:C2H2-type domain-containing protein n=1 Tax=Marasmius crinis-equi TaxID=585013 RepID=A0ABR3EKQ4_9AGAR